MITTTIQLTALVLLVCWGLYWRVTEFHSNRVKPKTKPKGASNRRAELFSYGLYVLVALQLLGVPILQIGRPNLVIQSAGLALIVLGFLICIKARLDLSHNWAPCYDYQIKTRHQLVTHGIYHYIRHPIYTGIDLMLIGSQLVAQSVLLVLAIAVAVYLWRQAGWEETLLARHFGAAYTSYIARTKRLIPFVL
jgi:protein-S-isoprenylcysteine O-methyltransferase Ste14